MNIVLEKIQMNEFDLSDEEILELLRIDVESDEFYLLISKSNELSRKKFSNKGYVFTQIGINAEPCSMNVHEPTQMALLAGVNQLYAEAGANPRDTKSETEEGRGFTPDMAWDMLSEAGYRA